MRTPSPREDATPVSADPSGPHLDDAELEAFLRVEMHSDPAHDLLHVRRVVATASKLAEESGASLEVVRLAAWLHDCVTVAKDSQQRSQASRIAAERAGEFLGTHRYSDATISAVVHAIEAHSFSADIPPRTLEARVVQDADRLDALGAIGVARCLMVGAKLDRPLYQPVDPFCDRRDPDDNRATIDHFFTKLLGLSDTMQTSSGRREADRRTQFMHGYLEQLRSEIPSE